MIEVPDAPEPPTIVHNFVDEAGTPTLFGARGKVLVGLEGCSKYFLMGKISLDDPTAAEEKLSALRADLLADPYFRNVPSMQPEKRKTAEAFHAKDDLPEVRREVFKLIRTLPVKFRAVVRDKRELLTAVRQKNASDATYRYRENDEYDELVTRLFARDFHEADQFEVTYARRGNKPRTQAFGDAIVQARLLFERNFGISGAVPVQIHPLYPREAAGLQIVDYFLWALQRFYETPEHDDRFLELIWPQTRLVLDLNAGASGTEFTQARKLTRDRFEVKQPKKKKGRRV